MADILAAHADAFFRARGESVGSANRRIVRKIVACRTPALGGHIEHCDQCDHERISYNSCRDRHCPKCQAVARNSWLEARQADLLPVEYFHVVFTVPTGIAAIALQNKRAMYGILMRAAMETLQQIAADPKHLGARIGALAILHTWGQTLMHHPHVHCVVPGGGLSPEHDRWISCPRGFLLPVKVLGAVFRGKFIEMTRKAFAKGELSFFGNIEHLNDANAFESHLDRACATNWVVYAKPPFGGPDQVLKYLARYTHRVAISNHRLVSVSNGRVKFSWKDYAHGSRHRTMNLEAHEFIRRFLLHVLPKGFMRIRHCGFLANTHRAEQLRICRSLLGYPEPTSDNDEAQGPNPGAEEESRRCPSCIEGRLTRRKLLAQELLALELLAHPREIAPRAKPPPALLGIP